MSLTLQKKRSGWKRTWGIVNLPLAWNTDSSPILKVGRDNKVKQATNPSMRYLFFELDSMEEEQLKKVLAVYFINDLPVYYHRTMRGWHFLSVKSIPKELHAQLMREIKHLNPECPHVTIRIKPNKWVGESNIFKVGYVQYGCKHDDLDNIRIKELESWMQHQFIGLIRKHYKVVNYPFGDDKE